MIRTFLEYQVQRSLDDSHTLPTWLRILLQYDARLRQFADQSRQLDQRLRTGAIAERGALWPELRIAPQRVELAPQREPAGKRDHAGLAWLSTAAIAATLAIGVFTLRTTERRANAEHARYFSKQLTAVPEEMASMLTLAVNRSQAELPRYNPLAKITFPEMNLLADLSAHTEASMKNQLDSIVSPWESLPTQLFSEWNLSAPINLNDEPRG